MPDTPSSHDPDLERLRSLTCIKWTRYDRSVLPAWVADMDLPPAPEIVEAVRALADRGDFGYNFAAAMKLPGAFADWLERRHHWRPHKSQIRLFCDVMQAVQVALWLHTEPGDGVVVFTPIYPPFLSTVSGSNLRLDDCPLQEGTWRLDPERLDAVVDERTRAILLCNPHNPTGRMFDREELTAVADVAERHDLLVISDEIWFDLTRPGATHIPFATVSDDTAGRTVTVSAASKSFNLAGLMCAAAVIGHPGIADAIDKLPKHALGAVGSPGAEASLAAWTQAERWLDATRAFLTGQRDHVIERLGAELPDVRVAKPEATYLAWLDFRDLDLGPDPAGYLLEHAKVALGKGLDFGERGAGFARLNFATTRPILDEILDRIVAAMR